MSDPIILTVPEDISLRARHIAETTETPVEQVLIDHLKTLSSPLPALPPAEQAELDALRHLSDDTLWTIAQEQMPSTVNVRAQVLMDKNTHGTISPDEAAELETLAARADRLMLRKAEAAAILTARGYPFTPKDFKPQDE